MSNVDTPEDAVVALANGAEGIGLCRTEHMFFSRWGLWISGAACTGEDQASPSDCFSAPPPPSTSHFPPHARISPERISAVRRMIAATELGSPVTRDEALEELQGYQRGDFEGIFRCDSYCICFIPFIISLMDPGLRG